MENELLRVVRLVASVQPAPGHGYDLDAMDGAIVAARAVLASTGAAPSVLEQPTGWQPIETAPMAERGHRPMFVVQAFNVCNGFTGGRPYTSDPWSVWRTADGEFARWPHHFAPTHWMPLPPPPISLGADTGEGVSLGVGGNDGR